MSLIIKSSQFHLPQKYILKLSDFYGVQQLHLFYTLVEVIYLLWLTH